MVFLIFLSFQLRPPFPLEPLIKCEVKRNEIVMILIFPGHSDKMMKKRRLNFICAYALTFYSKYFDLADDVSSPNWSELAIVFTG